MYLYTHSYISAYKYKKICTYTVYTYSLYRVQYSGQVFAYTFTGRKRCKTTNELCMPTYIYTVYLFIISRNDATLSEKYSSLCELQAPVPASCCSY